MDAYQLATRDTPRAVEREITRYGGLNPHGQPMWRVVLAQNVREQSFGTMRHMPRVSADADITDIEPERFESGEFWQPRYLNPGWILERWFPPAAWGSQEEWEQATSEDGVTRLKGEWPRHGEYFMVSEEALAEPPPIDHWKREIARLLREEAQAERDPATHLSQLLYLMRTGEQQRNEAYLGEVNYIHRGVVDPMLATVSRTAQRMREQLAGEIGLGGHLAAG